MFRIIQRLLCAALAVCALLSGAAAQQGQPGTVSSMPFASTPLSGSELLYLIQNGLSKKLTAGAFLAQVGGVTLPATTNLYKGTGATGTATPAIPGTDYLIPSALPSGSTSQIYAGTGAAGTAKVVSLGPGLTVSGGTLNVAIAPINVVAVYGLLNNGTNPAGVNDTQIAAAITAACSGGGRLYFPAGTYLFANAINVTCSDVGFEGDGSEVTMLITSSGSNNFINFTGPGSGTYINHNFLRHLSVGRTVNPTISSESKNVNLTWTDWAVIDDVFSYNGVYEFYWNNSEGTRTSNTQAFRTAAYQGAGDNYYGYFATGSSTFGIQELTFINATSTANDGNGTPYGGTSVGFYFGGASMHDLFCVRCEADNTQIGFEVDGSTNSGTLNWDIHFLQSSSDTFTVAGFFIYNMQHASNISIVGGWTGVGPPVASSASGIDISGSSGVTVTGVESFGGGDYATTNCLYATNSFDITYNNNICQWAANGVLLDHIGGVVYESTFNNNVFYADSAASPMTHAFFFDGTTRSTISGNVINGGAANTVAFAFYGVDTPGPLVISGNQVNPAAVTTSIGGSFEGAPTTITTNPGINPRGSFTPATSIANGTTWTNLSAFNVMVTFAGGSVSGSVSVNGTATGLTSGAFTVPVGGTFLATWTGSPTITYQGM